MAIKMTREEYEKKYGGSPSISGTPIKMTQEEYDKKYKKETLAGSIIKSIPRSAAAAGLSVARGVASPFSKTIREEGLSANIFGKEVGDLQKQMQERADTVGGRIRGQLESGDITKAGAITRSIAGGAGIGLGGTLELANFVPGEALFSTGAKAIKTGFKPARETIKNLIKEGGSYGFATGLSEGLQDVGVEENFAKDILNIAKKSLGGAGIGAGGAGAFGVAGAGLSKGVGSVKGIGGTLSKAKQSFKEADGFFSSLSEPVKTLASEIALPDSLGKNIRKSLGKTAKTTLNDAANTNDFKAMRAFDIMHGEAPNIKVIDADGLEKTFDPKNTNYIEMPQALKQAKDSTWNKVETSVDDATKKGISISKEEIAGIISKLKSYSGKGYTAKEASTASSLLNDILQFSGGNEMTPMEVNNLITKLNDSIDWKSTKIESGLQKETAAKLRDMLDSKIEKLGGKYQSIRDDYAALKSIEKDVINKFKIASRSQGNTSLFEGLASLDAVGSILAANPVAGGAKFAFGKALKELSNSENYLRKAFSLIDDAKMSTPTVKGTQVLSEMQQIAQKYKLPQEITEKAIKEAQSGGITQETMQEIAPIIAKNKIDAQSAIEKSTQEIVQKGTEVYDDLNRSISTLKAIDDPETLTQHLVKVHNIPEEIASKYAPVLSKLDKVAPIREQLNNMANDVLAYKPKDVIDNVAETVSKTTDNIVQPKSRIISEEAYQIEHLLKKN